MMPIASIQKTWALRIPTAVYLQVSPVEHQVLVLPVGTPVVLEITEWVEKTVYYVRWVDGMGKVWWSESKHKIKPKTAPVKSQEPITPQKKSTKKSK